MGFLSSLFAGPETAGKVADAVISAGDAAWFSNEEKAKWYLQYLEATAAQNRSRRLIAIVVVGLWAFVLITLLVSKIFSDAYAEFVFNILTDVVMQPFSIIVGFYFLKSLVSEAKK